MRGNASHSLERFHFVVADYLALNETARLLAYLVLAQPLLQSINGQS